MPYLISGWNSFYEGWLASCFEQPCDLHADGEWKDGWRIGNETGENKMLALNNEIMLGQCTLAGRQAHVTVEMIKLTEDPVYDS